MAAFSLSDLGSSFCAFSWSQVALWYFAITGDPRELFASSLQHQVAELHRRQLGSKGAPPEQGVSSVARPQRHAELVGIVERLHAAVRHRAA